MSLRRKRLFDPKDDRERETIERREKDDVQKDAQRRKLVA